MTTKLIYYSQPMRCLHYCVQWFLCNQRSLTADTRSDKHNIVYCQAYISEMTFEGHSRSLLIALLDGLDMVSYYLPSNIMSMYHTISEVLAHL